jgi:hypothetical protein
MSYGKILPDGNGDGYGFGYGFGNGDGYGGYPYTLMMKALRT